MRWRRKLRIKEIESFPWNHAVPEKGGGDRDANIENALAEGTGLIYGILFDAAEDGAIRIRSRDPRMVTIISCYFDTARYIIRDGQILLYPPQMRSEWKAACESTSEETDRG